MRNSVAGQNGFHRLQRRIPAHKGSTALERTYNPNSTQALEGFPNRDTAYAKLLRQIFFRGKASSYRPLSGDDIMQKLFIDLTACTVVINWF